MAQLHFELVTPERAVLSTEAYMVVVPGSEGDFGAMVGHAPLMTTIRDGEIRIYSDANTISQRITVAGGFAEMGDAGLTVLAESATINA